MKFAKNWQSSISRLLTTMTNSGVLSRADNSLILDDDGELHIVKETLNSMDGRVYAGRAIYIATPERFRYVGSGR